MKPHRIGMSFWPTLITRIATRSCLFLAVGLCLSGCKQEVKVDVTDHVDPSGTYTLVAVNGIQLPAAVTHGGTPLEVQSGTFVINADGTCSSKVTFQLPSGDKTTREVDATYITQGANLHMQWKGAGKTTGTIDGNTFTMDNEGMVFTYEK